MRRREGYRYFALCGAVSLLWLGACTQQPKQTGPRTFPATEIPVTYVTPETRATYMAHHFWDKFDFTDTAYVESATLVSEQAIVDYLSGLRYAPYDDVKSGISETLTKASQNKAMYIYFYTVMSHYLFDNMNSPLRNYEFYIPVLEHAIASEHLDERRKARPQVLLAQLQKNRPGMPATDIRYETPSGAKSSLYAQSTDYTLVVFYSPDCNLCKDVMGAVEASEVVKTLRQQKRLTLLAVYPGNDMELWRSYQPTISGQWINGRDYDQEINGKETYAMWSIPSIYLFDRSHNVVLKETPFNYVEYYLGSLLQQAAAASAQPTDSTVTAQAQ